MKHFPFSLVFLLFACGGNPKIAGQENTNLPTLPADPEVYAATITVPELEEHLYIYASDEFEGRETGELGQKKAVQYISNYYDTLGVGGALPNNGYYQKVPLERKSLPQGTIAVGNITYAIGDAFATFESCQTVETTIGEIVYAGYGIDDIEYSDYNNLDVKDKWVLIKSGEPKLGDSLYLISGTTQPSKWSDLRASLEERMALAQRKGAKGVLFYEQQFMNIILQRFKYQKMRSAKGNARMSLGSLDSDFMYFFVNEHIATSIFPNILRTEKAQSITTDVKLRITSTSEKVDTENVVAVITGSEKPEEYVVISSHLDHIGISPSGAIYNGADDDGSGTVAMLEMAEAFKKAQEEGYGPKRSIVFLHFTGEEKGLLGSRYYAQASIFPLENTVADLNIDMIGRIDPQRQGSDNYVYLIGSDILSKDLHLLSETVNATYSQMELDYKYNDPKDPNRFYYRSDHYNFAKNNVPVIFYFNGTHEDYHRDTDTPDKIEYDLLAKRATLIFHTAWEIANREERIRLDKVEEVPNPQ